MASNDFIMVKVGLREHEVLFSHVAKLPQRSELNQMSIFGLYYGDFKQQPELINQDFSIKKIL